MRGSAVSLTIIAALGLAALGWLALPRAAGAQNYPPPVGSLSVEAPSTSPGSTTTVTATVLDNAGDPVKDAEVTFTIVSQPGSDAAWSNGELEVTATTDGNGLATALLSVGSTSGDIIVQTVSGEKTSQVTVAATSELPETGGLPASEGSGGVPAWQIAVMAIGGAVLVTGLGVIAWRNRRA